MTKKYIKDKQELMYKIVNEYSVDIELLHDIWDLGYDRGIEVGEKEITYYQKEIQNLKQVIVDKFTGGE